MIADTESIVDDQSAYDAAYSRSYQLSAWVHHGGVLPTELAGWRRIGRSPYAYRPMPEDLLQTFGEQQQAALAGWLDAGKSS